MLTRALGAASGLGEAAIGTLARGDAGRQSRALRDRAHRPWPVPEAPWLQGQTWRDLLFAHWPLPVERLRHAVPAPLPIDTFDGSAWIAVTPFEVTGLRLRGTWPVPGLSRFAETNVRTYVTVDGKPGIYFFSLDAASAPAAAAARASYRLPYFRMRATIDRAADAIDYGCGRIGGAARLRVRYRGTGPAFHAAAGTLEHFLTERYCLYTVHREDVHRAEIHHPPWSLQPAEAELTENTMAAAAGIDLPAREPLLHYAERQDVVIWAPTRVGSDR